MNRSLEFFMPMKIPTTTVNSVKFGVQKGKAFRYKSPELEEAIAKFTVYLGPHAPDEPLDGPLRLTTKWLFPMIKGVQDGQPKHTKPDLDNLFKAFNDCLEKLGFIVNDSRIAESHAVKVWSKVSGIYVKIEEIGGD